MPTDAPVIEPAATPEPIYRLPPDWVCQFVAVSLAETHDWSLATYGVPGLWKQTKGKGLKICVLDTGVDLNHVDLQGAIADAKDFTGSMYGPQDRHGHGTWCCGMIGARAGNDTGVAGIAPECSIYSGKVLGDNGAGTDQSIAAGLRWAMSLDVDIVSMSLGGPQMSGNLRALFKEFVSKPRKFIFAAAGNDGPGSPPNYPGAWPETISVAAVDKDGKVTSFSSRGDYVDIAGPGYKMLSTVPGGYGEMSGTCLAKGSWVYGPNGPRPIEQIQAGEVVYAYKDGRVVNRVVHANHYRGRNTVHRLCSGGRDVWATETHQILAVDTKARDLDWVRVGELKEHHRPLIPKQLETNINPYLDAQLDEDWCWLLGFFAGDGWICETNRSLRFCGAIKANKETNIEVQRVYQKCVGKPLKAAENGSWFYDDSTAVAVLISVLGMAHYAQEKTIPLWLWNLPSHKRQAFYRGYLATDGHRNKKRNHNHNFECTSPALMDRLRILDDYEGWGHGIIRSRTRTVQPPNSPAPIDVTSHQLNINLNGIRGGWNDIRPSKGFRDGAVTAREMGIDTDHFSSSAWELCGESRIDDVYDLTVPDADCFVTQGIVTHNSMATPFVAAIGALAYAKHKASGNTKGLDSLPEMLAALKATAKDKGVPGLDKEYGWGVIDPEALLKSLDPKLPPEPPPLPPPEQGKELVFDSLGLVLHFPARVGDAMGVSLIPKA